MGQEYIVQPIPWAMNILYNGWCMGHGYIVQPMGHENPGPLYNSYSMEHTYHCTIHNTWGLYYPILVVQPNTVGNSSIHHPWIVQ